LQLLKEFGALLILGGLFAFPVTAEPPQHPMTVCEFVQHIKKLDGQIVGVPASL